jgi:hypothetical protein
MIVKESGQPEIWGTDGLGKDIIGAPLMAEPCFTNINICINNTDLALFADVNMFQKEHEKALWDLNDFGIIADVYQLRQEPQQ